MDGLAGLEASLAFLVERQTAVPKKEIVYEKTLIYDNKLKRKSIIEESFTEENNRGALSRFAGAANSPALRMDFYKKIVYTLFQGFAGDRWFFS